MSEPQHQRSADNMWQLDTPRHKKQQQQQFNTVKGLCKFNRFFLIPVHDTNLLSKCETVSRKLLCKISINETKTPDCTIIRSFPKDFLLAWINKLVSNQSEKADPKKSRHGLGYNTGNDFLTFVYNIWDTILVYTVSNDLVWSRQFKWHSAGALHPKVMPNFDGILQTNKISTIVGFWRVQQHSHEAPWNLYFIYLSISVLQPRRWINKTKFQSTKLISLVWV